MPGNKGITEHRIRINQFLRARISMLIVLSSTLILVAVYFIFFHEPTQVLFPNSTVRCDFYNDSTDNGNSVLVDHSASDTSLLLTYILRNGFVRPYVGINMVPEPDNNFDVSAYNRFTLEAKGNGNIDLVIYIITENNTTLKSQGRFSNLYFSFPLEISTKRKTYSIKLNRFKTPEWWYDINNLSPNLSFEPDWKHIAGINITTGLTPAVDIKRSFEVNRVVFERNNSLAILAMVLIETFIIIFLFTFFYLRSKPSIKAREIVINYKPVPYDNPDDHTDNFLEFINQNYPDCDLTLRKISDATGFSQRTIAEGIAENFNCNLKTYINRIRINEAKRLLKETDLNISEIAYNVGFNSPSNFNRVFKNMTNLSPTEFLADND